VCWDGDGGGVPDDFVGDAPLSVGVLPGEVEGSGVDLDCRISLSETATKVFKVCPVYKVRMFRLLGVGQSRLKPSPTWGQMLVR